MYGAVGETNKVHDPTKETSKKYDVPDKESSAVSAIQAQATRTSC